jgi:hypothetical protein
MPGELAMPLPAIPPDPEPTEEQYSKFLSLLLPFTVERARVACAKFFWRCDLRQQEPNLFMVPFKPPMPGGYPTYLESPLWHTIRKRVLDEAEHECACCFSRATEVHHRDYRPRVLSGDDISPLVALCAKCHRRIDNLKGKESWNKAEALLASLVERKEARISRRDTVLKKSAKL